MNVKLFGGFWSNGMILTQIWNYIDPERQEKSDPDPQKKHSGQGTWEQILKIQPMKDAGVAGLLVEEEAEDGEVEDGEPEAHRREVLVLLHEEVGAVADVEVGHDEGEPGEGEDQLGEASAGEGGAQAQLPRLVVPILRVPETVTHSTSVSDPKTFVSDPEPDPTSQVIPVPYPTYEVISDPIPDPGQNQTL